MRTAIKEVAAATLVLVFVAVVIWALVLGVLAYMQVSSLERDRDRLTLIVHHQGRTIDRLTEGQRAQDRALDRAFRRLSR